MRERQKSKKYSEEVIVKLPRELLNEHEHTVVHRENEHDDFVYISTKRYITVCDVEHMRDAMMKGYVEMSHINLKIATECLHAEYEAQHTVERLVSGS